MPPMSSRLLVLLLAQPIFALKPFLADHRQGDSGEASVAQRFEATTQRINGLQEKQTKVMSKLQAAAKAGRLNALNEASGGRLASQLVGHVSSLQTELKLLRDLEFPRYEKYEEFAEKLRSRSQQLHDVLDTMTNDAGIPDMLRKSIEYKKSWQELQAGMKKIEKVSIPNVIKKIQDEKAKEIQDLTHMDLEKAFTHKDKEMIETYSKEHPDDLKLVTDGVFPKEDSIKNADMGKDPYMSMSGDPWSNVPCPYGPDSPECQEILDAAKKEMKQDLEQEKAQDIDVGNVVPEDEGQKPFMVVKIPPHSTGDSNSMVEVHARNLALQKKNSSEARN